MKRKTSQYSKFNRNSVYRTLVSCLLAVLLAVTLLPVSALTAGAAEEAEYEEELLQADPEGVTVTFDGNGKGYTEIWNEEEQKYEQAEIFSEVYTPEDGLFIPTFIPNSSEMFEFNGWYEDRECTIPANFDNGLPDGVTAFYAGWKQLRFTVTTHANLPGAGYTACIMNENEEPVYYEDYEWTSYSEGQMLEPGFFYAEAYDGQPYAFDKWYFDKECTKPFDEAFELTEDIDLYAHWNELYSITFDANGGFFSWIEYDDQGQEIVRTSSTQSYPVEKESSCGQCPAPEHNNPNYIFKYEWNDKADGSGTTYTGDQAAELPVTGDITLFAQWDKYLSITFAAGEDGYLKDWDENGNSIEVESKTYSNQQYKSGDVIEDIAQFGEEPKPKEGRKVAFAGWYLDQGFENPASGNIVLEDDIVFYAKWDPAYQVTFDPNGGYFDQNEEKDKSISMVLPGGEVGIIPHVLHRDNHYQFNGWNTKKDGTGDYVSQWYKPSADTEVFAQWAECFVVALDPNGGQIYSNNDAGQYEYKYLKTRQDSLEYDQNEFYVAFKDGKECIGWSRDKNAVEPEDLSTIIPTGDMVLYAVWPVETIPVTGVSLNKTKENLTVNGTSALVATVTPANAANKAVTWSSSDASVAAVDANGKVTAKKPGTATITVKTADGGKTASCTVTVKAAPTPTPKPTATPTPTPKPTATPTPAPKPTATPKPVEKVPIVSYRTHVQKIGWQGWKKDGDMSGTTGESKRLEAINIQLSNLPYSGSIMYRTHVQKYGWQGWKIDGEMAGTSGEGKRLEAIQIQLTGEMEKHYDVYYQTHIQHFGWSGWASNGEMCGSAGYAYRLEGIRIKLVKKGEAAPGKTANLFYAKPGSSSVPVSKTSGALVGYNTHVQTYGWQNFVYDGGMAGTSGQSKRLEGINIKLVDKPYSGDIVYRTHVQKYGWQAWKKNGQMSGTSGEAKRLEGIQIYLTGEMAKHYDVYYRVHAQTYGWLDWAKNGAMAGTSGLSKRLEAINIKLVPKGGKAPGNTARPSVVGGGGKLPDNPYKE